MWSPFHRTLFPSTTTLKTIALTVVCPWSNVRTIRGKSGQVRPGFSNVSWSPLGRILFYFFFHIESFSRLVVNTHTTWSSLVFFDGFFFSFHFNLVHTWRYFISNVLYSILIRVRFCVGWWLYYVLFNIQGVVIVYILSSLFGRREEDLVTRLDNTSPDFPKGSRGRPSSSGQTRDPMRGLYDRTTGGLLGSVQYPV